MALPPMHTEQGLNLPMQPETGAAVLGIGFVVLVVITYDIYRQHWRTEGVGDVD